MSTIGDRIKSIRTDYKLSQDKFGEKVGVKHAAISMLEKNERNLTDAVMRNIVNEFCVNEAWLLEGVGEKYNQDQLKKKELLKSDFLFMSSLLLARQKELFDKIDQYDEDMKEEIITVLERSYALLDVNDLEGDNIFFQFESMAGMISELTRFLETVQKRPEGYNIKYIDRVIKSVKSSLIDVAQLYIPGIDLNEDSTESAEDTDIDSGIKEFAEMFRQLDPEDAEELKAIINIKLERKGIKSKGRSSIFGHGEEAASSQKIG